MKILLVDDHVIVRDGIAGLINQCSGMKVVATAEDFDGALRAFSRSKPNLAIIDISLRNGDGIDLVKAIRSKYGLCPIIMLSMHDESIYGPSAIRAGAMAYVMKDQSMTKLLDAIQHVSRGRFYLNPDFMTKLVQKKPASPQAARHINDLTDREHQVFRLIAQWRTPKQIAADLKLSRKTVDYYRARLKVKFGLRSVSQLTRFAVEKPPDLEPPAKTEEPAAKAKAPTANREAQNARH